MPTDDTDNQRGVGVAEFDAITEIAAEYALGPVNAVTRPLSGTMNEMFLLSTDDGPAVLRRHRRTDRSLIDQEHQIMDHARERGIPVPAAFATPAGDRIVARQGQWHSVFAFAPGLQVTAAELSRARIHAMGAMLARIHLALLDFPVPEMGAEGPRPTAEQTLQRLEELKSAISARAELTQEDRDALEYLDSQADALSISRAPSESTAAAPRQLIHGDYQHTNLFFDDDGVSAVIDWDKAEPSSPGRDVVRAMDLSLEMQPTLCRAFIDGYQDVLPLTAAALDAAAAEYGFGQLHGLWAHESVYLRGDDRVRQFLTPAPFVPFAERWAQVRPGTPVADQAVTAGRVRDVRNSCRATAIPWRRIPARPPNRWRRAAIAGPVPPHRALSGPEPGALWPGRCHRSCR